MRPVRILVGFDPVQAIHAGGPRQQRVVGGVGFLGQAVAVFGCRDDDIELPASSLIFTGSRGGVLRRSNFRRAVKWSEAVAAIGAPGLHFHDLRHTGNSLAAATGSSLRDLMDRMGHDSARAALIYQHKTAAAGRAIADALSAQIDSLDRPDSDHPGTR